ncbi:MAG: CoA pyrophosphatase [Gammaproteobacteria bacterium]|nr:CoA pyrophosphatase [Gammaproteobacteria bacterium]
MRALITEKLSRLPPPTAVDTRHGLRNAAVLLPLLDYVGGIRLLLTQRTQHLHHHPGQISLPGGIIEVSDASPIAAALRETEEEIGVPSDKVDVIGQLEPISTRTGFHIVPVVGFIAADVPLALDRFEVESVLEVPLEFLLNGGNYQRQSRLIDGAGDISYYALDYDGKIIWGATAKILVDFARQLGVVGIPD